MAANYVLLERIELNASASSITFSNIPQTGYTDLKVVVSSRLDNTDSPIKVNFNGVTTGYSWRRIYGNGSSASSLSGTDAYYLHGDTSSMTASTFSNSEFYVPNYTSSNYKSISVDTALETNATGGELFMLAALWSNTAAITSINMTPLTGSFVANSTFSLYGIAAVGTTPVTAPKADGGNVIATDGTYWYHAFLSNGTFTPQVGLSADVLVVAGGGGGGGGGSGGGGGAGGIFYATSQSLSASSYTCTIGGGGGNETNGTNSTFGSLTAAIGGGGSGGAASGQNGGSGGGAYPSFTGGTSTQTSTGGTGYGNAGGAGGVFSSPYSSGGGGGAGAVGGAGNSGAGQSGAGGAGLNTWSAWATATNTGASGYFAGGGGGGANQQYGGTSGAGGVGGGGAGGNLPTVGTINTGGGGGGSSRQPSGVGTGATGGSGIIIVRYPVA